MKTAPLLPQRGAAAIVMLADRQGADGSTGTDAAAPDAGTDGAGLDALQRARVFAEPLLTGQLLDTGEEALCHADGVATILADIGAGPTLRAAAYLVYTADFLQRPEEVVAKAFGASHASLVAASTGALLIRS